MKNKSLWIGCAIVCLLFLAILAILSFAGAWLYLRRGAPASSMPPSAADAAPLAEEPAPAAMSPDRFAFVRDGWIYFVSGPGAAPVQVARGTYPALSPDGTQVAYLGPAQRESGAAGDGTAAYRLWDMAGGRGRELIPTGGCMSPPAWSPDGSMLALPVIAGNDVAQLIRVDVATGEKTVLLQATHEADVNMILAPVWSGDGGRIFFHDMERLFELDLTGRRVKTTPLVEITGSDTCVTSADRFLPCPTDPNLLAYTRLIPASAALERVIGEPTTALFLYDRARRESLPLTPDTFVAFEPAWSRDGRTIFFCGYPETAARERMPFRIFRIALEGSGRDGSRPTELARGDQPAP